MVDESKMVAHPDEPKRGFGKPPVEPAKPAVTHYDPVKHTEPPAPVMPPHVMVDSNVHRPLNMNPPVHPHHLFAGGEPATCDFSTAGFNVEPKAVDVWPPHVTDVTVVKAG